MTLAEQFIEHLREIVQRDAESSSAPPIRRSAPVLAHVNPEPQPLTRSERVTLAGEAAGDTAEPHHGLRDLVTLCGHYLGHFDCVPVDEETAAEAFEACLARRDARFPNVPILALHRR